MANKTLQCVASRIRSLELVQTQHHAKQPSGGIVNNNKRQRQAAAASKKKDEARESQECNVLQGARLHHSCGFHGVRISAGNITPRPPSAQQHDTSSY
eukprot:scaffold2163_cov78-Skeletonema_dohrnii-CCMP3373.AAC.2